MKMYCRSGMMITELMIQQYLTNFDIANRVKSQKNTHSGAKCSLASCFLPVIPNAWEQRKLGEVLKITTRINNDNEYKKEDILSVSDEFGVINQIEFQGRSFAANDVSSYKKVEIGDIT